MKRKCHWCKKPYDSAEGSSIFCDSNPNKGRGYARWKKRRGPRIVRIAVLMR